jgi:ATP-dependent Lon protease
MEVIRLPGYTEDEKLEHRQALPGAQADEGQRPEDGERRSAHEDALRDIVRYYTREAGVRNLEREISKICRKAVKGLLLEKKKAREGGGQFKEPRQVPRRAPLQLRRGGEDNQIGQVTGLAWTEVGGELLTIEGPCPARARRMTTGKLGDVMKESIQAAMSVVAAAATVAGASLTGFLPEHDIHVHLPEGATPKDGPSAGIAICTAMVSVLTKIPVRVRRGHDRRDHAAR